MEGGRLAQAVSSVNPGKRRGPWHVLCDNESFLRAKRCRGIYRRSRITLWELPPRSPDLNPVEKYWGWLRRCLLRKDLDDLQAGKPPLDRMAYIARLRSINRSARARKVARNFVNGLVKVCRQVRAARGAHSGT